MKNVILEFYFKIIGFKSFSATKIKYAMMSRSYGKYSFRPNLYAYFDK